MNSFSAFVIICENPNNISLSIPEIFVNAGASVFEQFDERISGSLSVTLFLLFYYKCNKTKYVKIQYI